MEGSPDVGRSRCPGLKKGNRLWAVADDGHDSHEVDIDAIDFEGPLMRSAATGVDCHVAL